MAHRKSARTGGDTRGLIAPRKGGLPGRGVSSRTPLILLGVGLAAITLLVYFRVIHFDFVLLDDYQYVVDNPHVAAGLKAEPVLWVLTHSYAANWHPLTWISHMLDWELYGNKPGGHHFTSLLLHLVNSVLLLLVLNRMTGSLFRSALVAALFALHPLHVESVAWVSERKDVLSGFLWIATLGAYVRYTENPSLRRGLTVMVLFALGLTAKPMLVTLPFVLLLLDYWPLQRLSWPKRDGDTGTSVIRLLAEKLPLVVLAILSCVITLRAQEGGGAVLSLDAYPLNVRVKNAIVTYAIYILKMLWPTNLAAFYPHPRNAVSLVAAAAAALVLLLITVFVFLEGKRWRFLPVGWFWYLGTLVPVIGLVQVGMQARADRYTYLPLIGLFIVIAWSISDPWPQRSFSSKKADSAASPLASIITAATLVALAALAMRTAIQVGYWRDDITLFQHALNVTKDNYSVHNNLAIALQGMGRVDEAIRHYTEAIRINLRYADAHYNLGLARADRRQFDEAIRCFHQVLALRPKYWEAHLQLGAVFQAQGKLDEALAHFLEATRANPNSASAENNAGALLAAQGKYREAIEHYRQALRIQPDYAIGNHNLGLALAALRRYDEAVVCYTRALSLDSRSAGVHTDLGIALASQGKLQEAIDHLHRAVEMEPQFARAYENLAWVLLEKGDFVEAWKAVHLSLKWGGSPNPQMVLQLSRMMSEPKE